MYQIAVIRKYDYINVIHSYYMRIETVFSLSIIPATITYSTIIMDILIRFLRWILSEKRIYKYVLKFFKYFPCFHYLSSKPIVRIVKAFTVLRLKGSPLISILFPVNIKHFQQNTRVHFL